MKKLCIYLLFLLSFLNGCALHPHKIHQHISYLTSPKLEGRLTGTEGERKATAYAANELQRIGFQPAGKSGYFDEFSFTSGISLGKENQLTISGMENNWQIKKDWIPLSFSKAGEIPSGKIVFAGYGIKAPAEGTFPSYDSYVHLDVKDKWVMVFRFIPEGVSAEQRQHLSRYAGIRYKAMIARDAGAKGLLLVSGPTSKVRDELVPLASDVSLAGSSLAGVSLSDKVADAILNHAGKSLEPVQKDLDSGAARIGFEIPGVEVSTKIELIKEQGIGRNVIARFGNHPHTAPLILGAHIDHLGRGNGNTSLAKEKERGKIHPGADDNASGVAVVLEVAREIEESFSSSEVPLQRDLIVGLWSGEEIGLLGSSHYVRELPSDNKPYAYINLDMVGRLSKELIVQGVASAAKWREIVNAADTDANLHLALQEDPNLPTDTTSFYNAGIPILSFFTGAHAEYHTPHDTPDLINLDGTERIKQFVSAICKKLLSSSDELAYVAVKAEGEHRGAFLRAYFGTIPDYAATDIQGVKLGGVSAGGPAEKAGIMAGDIIVSVAGKKIENIYDYTYALEALKIGAAVTVEVMRAEKRLKFSVTPTSRQ